MTSRIQVGNLQVATSLLKLVNEQIIPGTDISSARFWSSLESIIDDLTPKNRALLARRDDLQVQIDKWHTEHKLHDPQAYKAFLQEIGYLVPEGDDFSITTENVDIEISQQAGPQLVVPVKNARFALNAANARWGSLYDALYGPDAISEAGGAEVGSGFNPVRGSKVIAFAKQH